MSGSRHEQGKRERGFTLVELLAVLVIIGLAASAVMLAVPDADGGLVAEAERFAARAKAARDGAIVESRATALDIGPAGYSVSRRERGEWRTLQEYRWTEDMRAEPAAAGTVFDATGLADPLSLTLSRRDRRVAIDIGHDGAVAIRR